MLSVTFCALYLCVFPYFLTPLISFLPSFTLYSKIPSSPILSRGNSNQLDVNASNDSFDKLWMDDGLVEYESSISDSGKINTTSHNCYSISVWTMDSPVILTCCEYFYSSFLLHFLLPSHFWSDVFHSTLMFLFHSYDKLESSKKFVPTVSRKVEPDWARNFENDHFAPLISVDDILSFDDAGLSSHNSSPLYKGSPPPRKASSTGMLDGGKHSISLSLSIYIYIYIYIYVHLHTSIWALY